jgi:two-component system sensor histidine kinase CssS
MKKKKFKSISRKIMLIMLTTISIFSVVVLLFNMTLLNQSKEGVVFHQLRESASAKSRQAALGQARPDIAEEVWAAHFYIKFEDNQYGVYTDRNTKKIDHDKEVVATIAARVYELGEGQSEGKVEIRGKQYYFYREWIEKDEEAMVFFASPLNNTVVTKEMILFLGASILVAFITSRLIANSIAKQLKGLDQFAEEIAKRNWDAEVPKTEQDEIGLLAHSLEKMRDALRVAEERDRQFLQSTSHDLKTPVMVIKGYAQAIIDQVDVAQEKPKANIILLEAEKLEKRIVQLLRLNTLDQALGYSEEWETVRLDRLVRSVAERFKVVSPTLNWELALEEKEIKGNKEALLIAFENLLDNQCRFARQNVRIEMKSDHIRIINDGEPFKIKDTQSLFVPLVTDNDGKFGLGLAIVYKVMKGHDWEIEAYNLENGVCFDITMKKG